MAADTLFTGYDHVAYATRDTDATVTVLRALGFAVTIYKQELARFKVFITKLVSAAGHVAEVVEPTGPGSVVSGVLADRAAAVYHTCFRANDFHQAFERLKRGGAVTITRPLRIP